MHTYEVRPRKRSSRRRYPV